MRRNERSAAQQSQFPVELRQCLNPSDVRDHALKLFDLEPAGRPPLERFDIPRFSLDDIRELRDRQRMLPRRGL